MSHSVRLALLSSRSGQTNRTASTPSDYLSHFRPSLTWPLPPSRPGPEKGGTSRDHLGKQSRRRRRSIIALAREHGPVGRLADVPLLFGSACSCIGEDREMWHQLLSGKTAFFNNHKQTYANCVSVSKYSRVLLLPPAISADVASNNNVLCHGCLRFTLGHRNTPLCLGLLLLQLPVQPQLLISHLHILDVYDMNLCRRVIIHYSLSYSLNVL